MKRLVPLVLRSSTLPLVVLALIAPSVAAFALVGPQLGLAVGALSAAAVIALAARARYDEPIVPAAAPGDGRYRLLVVAPAPLEHPGTIEEIIEIIDDGRRAPRFATDAAPQVMVLAPATSSRLARWASDVSEARTGARDRLAVSLAALAAAELDAVGRVGDGDVVQALEDELPGFAADEVAILTGRGVGRAEVEEVRRRLDRPVRTLEPLG